MQQILDRLNRGEASVAVVGLGYVGLPLAVHFGRVFRTLGFDINPARIAALQRGVDLTGEVPGEDLKENGIRFTADPTLLAEAAVIVVAVPTPIDEACAPDLQALIQASRTIGRHMRTGTVVVYESTVYPGLTEEICGPELEKASGLQCGRDFFLGYSPERINPGDPNHGLENIVKVVSAQNPEVLELIAEVYGRVVRAGIHRAPDIRTAEAAKVIENTQRDLNIALMNELAMLFHTLGLDTHAVLEAASTKWNFLKFQPGLVGGHCIGVDPYYLTHLAKRAGYAPKLILAGRQINDSMARYVAEQTVKQMIQSDLRISGARALVLGLTFKENVPDLRNSKVFDMIRELREYGLEVSAHDPVVSPESLGEESGETMVALEDIGAVDVVILAVKHRAYLHMGFDRLRGFATSPGVFIDIKSAFEPPLNDPTLRYWRL